MNVRELELPGLLLLEPRVFHDERGYFLESYSRKRYDEIGLPLFVQDNVSCSRRGVVRGLHYQQPEAQGKLVSAVAGSVFDVAVDLRQGSATFGRWAAVELSAENGWQLWIPAGFAHGFQALTDNSLFAYKCTAYYAPAAERSIRWDDPDIGIRWPVADPIVSGRDAAAPLLRDVPPEHLFTMSPGPARLELSAP